MIFAILGIFVLVVSFVIALVTLVREQSNLENVDDGQSIEGKKIVKSPIVSDKYVEQPDLHKLEELSPYQKPFDVTVGVRTSEDIVEKEDKGLAAVTVGESFEGKPHVWWERLDEKDDSLGEKNEDEQSIEKIRQELAKLMSTKANTEVTDEPEAGLSQEPTLGGLSASTLSGEFSLREMKNKD
jgi:hypothetical protein